MSDAKVLTGRQKLLTRMVMLFAEVTTEQGLTGMGFSYSKRGGGPAQYAHVKEIGEVLVGDDPNDIQRLYDTLLWAGASVGRSGVATQAIAAVDIALWDLKAKRARLPLAKLIGARRDSCRVYNTSGGFLQVSIEEVEEKASAALEAGIGGIKIKVGQPDWRTDLARVEAMREHLGDAPLMGDANQQWDRARVLRMCRALGRALRVARPALRRADGDPRRAHVAARPAGSRLHAQRADARADARERHLRRVRPA